MRWFFFILAGLVIVASLYSLLFMPPQAGASQLEFGSIRVSTQSIPLFFLVVGVIFAGFLATKLVNKEESEEDDGNGGKKKKIVHYKTENDEEPDVKADALAEKIVRGSMGDLQRLDEDDFPDEKE